MTATHFMASAMAARFDALRSVYDPRGVYYAMVASKTTPAGLLPSSVTEGASSPGLIRRGVYMVRRRFDREGAAALPSFIVAIRGPWTVEVLRGLRGIARFERGSATGELFPWTPVGVVHQPSEACFQYTAQSVQTDYALPATNAFPYTFEFQVA